MEITILKSILKNPLLDKYPNKGIQIERITALEAKWNQGRPYPVAIREFLYLAGEENNLGFDTHDSIERLQERCRESLAERNQRIDRPFFAFDQLDDCSQFTFVYLDEDQNDPDVYFGLPYYLEAGLPLIKRYAKFTFSSLVDDHIYRIKNDYPLQ